MPTLLTHLGPAAPSGLMRPMSRTHSVHDYRDNLFAVAVQPPESRARHVLKPKRLDLLGHVGRPDFVSSPDRDFHPTDVRRRRRRQPPGRRHRRLVQALLPDLAAPQARCPRRPSTAITAQGGPEDPVDPRGREARLVRPCRPRLAGRALLADPRPAVRGRAIADPRRPRGSDGRRCPRWQAFVKTDAGSPWRLGGTPSGPRLGSISPRRGAIVRSASWTATLMRRSRPTRDHIPSVVVARSPRRFR